MSKAQVGCFEWAAFFRCSEWPNRKAYEVKRSKQVKLCNGFEQINMLVEWAGNKHDLHVFRAHTNLPPDRNKADYPAHLHMPLYQDIVMSSGVVYVIRRYSGAKKYLVSHQLCKFSHLKRRERPVIFIIGIPQLRETK